MRYKAVCQFRWIIVVLLLALIYISNFILIRLPFISMDYSGGFTLIPKFNYELHIYSISTVIVWMCGILFGPKIGFLTLIIYIFLGLSGLPIFAGGGGLDYYTEPTFGYLISLPFNAFLSGYFFERNNKLLGVFIPMAATHLCGIIYLLLFKQDWLDITWHLSFSMISYDLFFALLLTPAMSVISFFVREIFIQEVKDLPHRRWRSSSKNYETLR